MRQPFGLITNYFIAYPIALINIAVESSLQLPHRTQALLLLKNWILACWSQINEEWKGPQCSEDVKQEVRKRLFPLVTHEERKIRTAAAYALSKIASSGTRSMFGSNPYYYTHRYICHRLPGRMALSLTRPNSICKVRKCRCCPWRLEGH